MPMDDNMTLRIDPDSRDLVFDKDGIMGRIYGDDTTGQCIRLTLLTWKGELFLDTTHGTEYDRVLGKKPSELSDDEAGEVIREALFQEQDVSHVNSLSVDIGNMAASITLDATLFSGKKISMGVTT